MLAVRNLTKAFDGFRLGPVDLSVDDEVLAVLGPSGCGKTTLLGLVAGTLDPDGGQVSLSGRRIDGRPPEERGVGVVFQDGALFPHMTARENVAYAGAGPERVEDLAATLEVAEVLDRPATALSGGERQRVALARALAADPDALLLDEPLANLDAPVRRRLREALHDALDSIGVPTVLVTHDRRVATAVGDRVAVMRDGEIEQVDTPSGVLDRPATPFVARFTGSENVFEARVVERDRDGVALALGDRTIRSARDAPAGASVTACVRPARIRLEGAGGSVSEPDGGNVLHGTVTRWLHEGDEYRVTVAIDGADVAVTAAVGATEFERAGVERGATVALAVAPEAVHLIEEV
ncbi:ABC transporter ATP-binding protein [Halostella salina]|uniref:ABC transporter ATP-binding protein n=1 Tax=Halostella salina TaxID=1547897 RepID=UPI000EF7E124|nr:ABC transporter ATP-binding protein [Halostella salina]